jgi:hypothetical protein
MQPTVSEVRTKKYATTQKDTNGGLHESTNRTVSCGIHLRRDRRAPEGGDLERTAVAAFLGSERALDRLQETYVKEGGLTIYGRASGFLIPRESKVIALPKSGFGLARMTLAQ